MFSLQGLGNVLGDVGGRINAAQGGAAYKSPYGSGFEGIRNMYSEIGRAHV